MTRLTIRRKPSSARRTGPLLALAFAAALASSPCAQAQGCAQCRDNTASTSPATQRAYRHAIELMTGAAAAFCLTVFVVAKRHP